MASERLTIPPMTSEKVGSTMGASFRRSFPVISDGTFASFLLHLDDVAPVPARTVPARPPEVTEPASVVRRRGADDHGDF